MSNKNFINPTKVITGSETRWSYANVWDDELIIECRKDVSLAAVCGQMGCTPPWAEGLVLKADGYETPFYKKD